MAVPILGLFFKYIYFLDVPETYINRGLSKNTARKAAISRPVASVSSDQ